MRERPAWGEMTATITCTAADTSTTGVGIDTTLDTTVTVETGVTVSHTGNVIDFNTGGGSAMNEVINNGTITTTGAYTILGGTGMDTVTNTGTLNGDVLLRNDDDTFTNELGGIVNGDISGGGEDDEITNDGTVMGNIDGHNHDDNLTNKGTVFRFEGGSGDDTIINDGTVGLDLWGENGNDMITNTNIITRHLNAGNDDDTISLNTGSSIGGTLDGGSGTDTLTLLGSGPGTRIIDHTVTNIEILNSQGDWTVNTAIDFVDEVTISSGTLTLQNSLTADDMDIDATVTVQSGATVQKTAGTDAVLDLSASDQINTVTNAGTITNSAGAGAIAIDGGSGQENITNTGTITGHVQTNDGDDLISLGTDSSITGTLDGGSGTDTLTLLGSGPGTRIIDHTVTNIEILNSQGDWTVNTAIDFVDEVTISSGTLTLQNSLTADDMDIDATVTVQSGATVQKTAGTDAVLDLSASDQINTVTNAGTITNSAGAGAIAIDGGSGQEIITNTGTITGHVQTNGGDDLISLGTDSSITGTLDGGTGADTLTLLGTGAGPGTIDHTVSNIEFLDLQGDWTLDENIGFTDATLSSGTLTLDTDRTLTLQNSLDAPALGTDTTVIVESGAILEKAAGTGTLINFSASAANYTVTNDGTLTGDILGGSGQEIITNTGTITGHVQTNGGDDLISLGTDSSITGTLDGGTGADTLTLLGTGAGPGTIDHTVSNIEFLDLQGDWTLDENIGFTDATLSSGTLTLDTDRTLTLQNSLDAPALGTDTTVIVESGAILEKAAGTGTLINFSASAANYTVTNDGTLTGDILGGSGQEIITNTGTITGHVQTNGGDDLISLGTDSSITGTLDGGTGADTLTLLGTGAGPGTIDHTVSNIEFLDLQGDWTLDENIGFTDATLSSGTLTLDTDRTLTLQNSLDAPALGTDTTVIVESGAILEKAAGTGTLINFSASAANYTVTNDGTLTGDILGGSGQEIITNTGTITGDVQTNGGNDDITNAGSITGSLLAGTGDDTISLNTGSSITGTLNGGSGTDSLTLLGTGTLDSSVTGIETLDSQGDWTVNTAAAFANGATLSSGTLSLQNTLTANTVIGSGATLMGIGTIDGNLTNNGILSPGNSIGTITITGDYVQNPGTTLEIEVSPTNGVSDQLLISGTAQLGGTLSIIPLGDIPSSNEYTFLTAAGGITGTFDDILNTSAFDFELDFSDPNAVLLKSVSVNFLANALTPNQRATGTYLDRIFSMATPELEANLATLGSIPDISAYQAALDQLNPEFFDAFTGKTFLENNWFNSALGTRRNHCWRQEPEHAPRLRSCGHRFGTWSQVDGSTIERKGGPQHISYDAEVYNLAMGGFWAPANGRASLQAALGYSPRPTKHYRSRHRQQSSRYRGAPRAQILWTLRAGRAGNGGL